ncbi:hypothetical protein MPSEU_000857800 [Mayamaea pseudoterrestris]|nr:hypothetical protein MPSEU_000857800 [Mayamaea pseudoterrestris]
MMWLPLAVVLLLLSADSSAFQSLLVQRRCAVTSLYASRQHDEFDYLLRESASATRPSYNNRRQVGISMGDSDKTLLVSSFAASPSSTSEEEMIDLDDDQLLDENQQEEEMFTGSSKVMQYQEKRAFSGIDAKLKSMGFQDVVITLVVPSILLFAGGRWTYNRLSAKVQTKIDVSLDSFAEEMLYHDGDFQEMKMCVKDYGKKLVYLGPLKRDKMVKRYLDAYAKRKTISPQAISSLSYAFTLFNLDEESAANLMVALCKEMGENRAASAGKLLFLGNRILKSPQGKKALLPIREMIKSTYRQSSSADTLMDVSQQAMAEAAYKTTVTAAGKNQSSLTPGWEVLGLQKEVAQRIWDEAAKEGFVTEREALYSGQRTKYDKNGNIITDEGKLVDPENANSSKDANDEPVSGVFECGKCGFTLFVATGRESKFYGSSFKCPECGAPKSEFSARDDFGEEE